MFELKTGNTPICHMLEVIDLILSFFLELLQFEF